MKGVLSGRKTVQIADGKGLWNLKEGTWLFPIGSMGRLYIYLHEWWIFMVNVGIPYTIHGSYGFGPVRKFASSFSANHFN